MTRVENPRSAPVSHDSFRELLPWYVNNTLEKQEYRGVQAHLGVAGHGRVVLLAVAASRAGLDPVAEPPPLLSSFGSGGDAGAQGGGGQ